MELSTEQGSGEVAGAQGRPGARAEVVRRAPAAVPRPDGRRLLSRSGMLLGTALLATPTLAAPRAPAVVSLQLRKVVVEVPSRERLRLLLVASPLSEATSRAYSHGRLFFGNVRIPLAGPGTSTDQPGGTVVHLEAELNKVPESVLALPMDVLSLRWEGTTDGGRTIVTVAGDVTPGDPDQLVLPVRALYDTYARLSDVSLAPSTDGLSFHALLGLFNPFSFDVVCTGLTYEVSVGGAEVLSSNKPGFRLRAGQNTDIPLDQTVSLTDVASAAMALMSGAPVGIGGELHLRTSKGEQIIPLQLGAAP